MIREYTTKQIIVRLLVNYIKPYRGPLILAIIFMIVVALCAAASIKLVQPAIDQIFLTHDKRVLIFMPLMMLGIFFIKAIAEYSQSYIIQYVGQKILTTLQIEMYEHLLFADLNFIQSQSSGRLISRFTNDISLMRGAVSHMLVGGAKHLLTVLFLIILMFQLEPLLSIFVFVAFPLAIYPVQKIGARKRKLSIMVQEELANYTSRLDETFNSIKVIKSFLGEKFETNRARTIADNILKFYKRAAKTDSLTGPIMEILSGIVIAGILWYGGLMVIDGTTTPGALMAFITAFVSSYRPFKSLLSLNVNLQEGLSAALRVFSILDNKPQISDHSNSKDLEMVNPEITYNNVTLSFDTKIVLDSLDLKLENSKIYAFVGCSGSGKTSLANLLMRFYDPVMGYIAINNHNIRDIKLQSLRKQISLVTQDTILFDDSIAQNIAYGVNNVSMDKIIEVAKDAYADEFINNLPNGYDTIIGPKGTTLSGGQRQRLAIARAFLKDSAILMLDEATSALDPRSETFVLRSLMKYSYNRIIILITHRLSSITTVDHIVTMKNGKIVEQGTHNELLDNRKEYYSLYNKELQEQK